ncbi:MAG: sigma-54 dependent transcriptional regulator [Wenzhouxiangellaceae bacterium]|nr:sigma-54 dependent transcriptional regulator [Wenzhouxiangellaceae bacterium]
MSDFCVLLVEDDAPLREALAETLELGGFDVIAVSDGPKALDVLADRAVSLLVSDIQMEPWDGLELLTRARRLRPDLPVVLMTAFGSVPQAVAAIRRGAMDYLVKPVEVEDLLGMVGRFAHSDERRDDQLIAVDPCSQRLAALARRVAETDVNVLMTGPSGSGKEAYSRYIHACSPRARGPFIAVNCAAIPESMLEAELFGHDKGAFTGAIQARIGKFEQANGGTLLLDEISEMDRNLQAKLLRVLQEREVERLGGNRMIDLDVRVIATSNRNLPEAVAQGRFREDLFYRLNVFPLHLPPLAERPGDIVPLAERALARYRRGDGPAPALDDEACRRLRAHTWPGNVRELENVIQRALVLAPGNGAIRADELFFEPPVRVQQAASAAVAFSGSGEALESARNEAESEAICQVLRQEDGHRGRAAERLGISPRTLRYKLSRMRAAGIAIPGDSGGREHATAGDAA